jgi:hypothetical protein
MSTPVYWLSNTDDVQLLVQTSKETAADYDELMALRAHRQGSLRFGTEYSPVELLADGPKKFKKTDISITGLSPFIVISERARFALSNFLDPVGQYLDVQSPWPGYIGFHSTVVLRDCVDFEKSTYVNYAGGPVIRRAVLKNSITGGHNVFKVEHLEANVYFSEEFRAAADSAGLVGLKFLPVALS